LSRALKGDFVIAVDTNILVRFLTGDDKQQFKKALTLFESHDICIPDTVILESEWVLRYAYNFTPDAICRALTKLFGLPNVHLTNPILISQALQWHEQGLDFADAMKIHCFEALTSRLRRFLTICNFPWLL